MPPPRLSILIPNYNNGRESSRHGDRDFIGDLLRSLEETLAHDPTPLEILIADDGSTDDSRETCRAWAGRRWSDGPRRGEPFCRLEEREHCGVLSVVANALTRAAAGEICCRLDGDIVVHTPRWAQRICRAFDEGPPTLGVVGPKQLGVDGRIHSAGSWILHPRGHHHVAQGADRTLITRAIEVDHVMGCFYCHRRAVWEQLDGYDETFLRGQTVDFGLRARHAGWRTWSIPDVEFTHHHADRSVRETRADSNDGIENALDRFAEKWGFDRLAPDLDDVARRYAGSPLLWNARVFGPATHWPPPAPGPIDIRSSEWSRFASDDPFREAINWRVEIVSTMHRALDVGPRVLQVRSRSGLLCHLLAGAGCECTGIDPDPHHVDLARQVAATERYAGPPPRHELIEDPGRWPVEDGAFDAVLLFDVLENHPNPVGLFKEAHRGLAPEGVVAIVTRQRMSLWDADHDALHGYLPHELVLQLQATRLFTPVVEKQVRQTPGAMVLFGRRRGAERTFYPAQPKVEGRTSNVETLEPTTQ